MRLLICLLITAFPSWVIAQIDTTSTDEVPDVARQIVEDYLQNTESESEFDFNTLFERFEYFREHPINLNHAEELDLRELGVLSDIQIINLIQYRQEAGELVAIYELQAIPGFDLATIRTILPFVTVSGDVDDFQGALGQNALRGR